MATRIEQNVISWLMDEPHASLEIEPGWFSDQRCQSAIEAIRSIAARGVRDAIDHWAVADAMGMADSELVVGWLQTLLQLTPLERHNWRHWRQRLLEEATKRKLREAAADMTASLAKHEGDDETRDEALARFQREVTELPTITTDEPATLYDVLRGAVDSLGRRVDARERGEQANLGVPTGVAWLDEKLGGGWPRGMVTVLAGRTSHGKSTVAQIAALAAYKSRIGVHYFCLEDGIEVFGARSLAQSVGLTVGKFFAGECDDIGRLTAQVNILADKGAMKNFLFETKRRPLEQLIARVDRYRAQNNTGVVIIDYLGLIPLPGDHERHQEVEMAVTRLQQAAIEQNVAYVVLHQLNRTFAGRQNKQPMLSDLRDSGAIEERAAVVVFAHRPNVDDGASETSGQQEIDDMHLVIAKNKFGPRNCLGKFRVDFSRYRILGRDHAY